MGRKLRVVILVHGGAGAKAAGNAQLRVLTAALQAGSSLLEDGGTSLDAVEAAIQILEDSGRFNAGSGSRLQLDGRCRMDAAIMEGQALKAGAVAGIEKIRNPIRAARLVMEKTPHVLMAGDGAVRLAQFFKIERSDAPTRTSLNALKKTLKGHGQAANLYKAVYDHETVGAVALDASGTLSAGASTGGIAAMLPGRVGDTPLIGSGVYADNDAGAVSMTGLGEGIIRAGLAKEICCGMMRGVLPLTVTEKSLKRFLARIQGTAGAIALNRKGEFALLHTSPFMCAGYAVDGHRPVVAAKFKRIK